LRLREGFDLTLFGERTGLPPSSVQASLELAIARGLLVLADGQVRPTVKGFDFLNDLQAIFLAP